MGRAQWAVPWLERRPVGLEFSEQRSVRMTRGLGRNREHGPPRVCDEGRGGFYSGHWEEV